MPEIKKEIVRFFYSVLIHFYNQSNDEGSWRRFTSKLFSDFYTFNSQSSRLNKGLLMIPLHRYAYTLIGHNFAQSYGKYQIKIFKAFTWSDYWINFAPRIVSCNEARRCVSVSNHDIALLIVGWKRRAIDTEWLSGAWICADHSSIRSNELTYKMRIWSFYIVYNL